VSLGGEGFAMTLTPMLIERLGIHTIAYSPLANGENFISLFDGEPAIAEGNELKITIDPQQVHLFDTAGQAVGL
jgi:multiple sugar transport system ATP-binding protein